MSVKTMLDQEIREEIENLGKVAIGSEEHKIAADALAKLLDKTIEMDKLDLEYQEKVESREAEHDLKLEQLKEEKKDHRIKNILTGVSVVGCGLILPIWGTIKSINFEKTGTITTIMGRGFIQKLLPTK